MQPLETITPLINDPYLPGKQSLVLELLPKVRPQLFPGSVVYSSRSGTLTDLVQK